MGEFRGSFGGDGFYGRSMMHGRMMERGGNMFYKRAPGAGMMYYDQDEPSQNQVQSGTLKVSPTPTPAK